MKKILVFIAILPLMVKSQNIITLKNGDRINGSVLSLINDTLRVNSQGNLIKYHKELVLSVIFDTNKSSETKIQNTIDNTGVNGLVTYFFNKNIGDRPDLGSKVYLIEKSNISSLDAASLDRFNYGRSYWSMYSELTAKGISVDKMILAGMKKYQVEDEDSFKALDKAASQEALKIMFGKEVVTGTVDDTGNFKIQAAPGDYYLLIKSNNRKSNSLTEALGKVFFQPVNIKPNNYFKTDVNFDQY